MLGILPSQNIVSGLRQSRNPVKLVFDHHTITHKLNNIQIRSKNRTKHVGHYTAPRRKITRVGGNLPLVAQFRVLYRPGLLTAQHSFLFLFFFFFFLFSYPFLFSFLISFLLSFPPFLLPFPPFPSSSFSFSLPPPPYCSHGLKLLLPEMSCPCPYL